MMHNVEITEIYFGKHFVKVTVLLNELQESSFDEIFLCAMCIVEVCTFTFTEYLCKNSVKSNVSLGTVN